MKKNFYTNSFLMSSVIFISRLFGFLRDVILASLFGTTYYGDAFYLALKIPNTFRVLLGEGAFTSAFVPIYSEYITKNEKEKEAYFLGNIFLRFSLILIIISILGSVFSKYIVELIAIGAINKAHFVIIASKALSITFWYLTLVGLSAFYMALQQANNSFGRPAAGQVVYNITFIIILFLLLKVKNIETRTMFAAWGVLIAGVFQLTYQYISASRLKRKFIFNLKHEIKNINRLFKILTPAIFGQAITEINIFFDNFFALFVSAGVISAMYYSYRLVQLPLGIFSVSIATVSLTVFSRKVSKNEDLIDDFHKSLSTLTRIMLPLSSYLIGGGIFLIKFLFLRGKFTEQSAILTNSLLIYYSIGLIFFSYTKLFAQVFYAHKLIKYPVIFTAIAMIMNIEMNMIFVIKMGAKGLALASTISAFFNFLMLDYYLNKHLKIHINLKKYIPFYISYFPITLLLLFLQKHFFYFYLVKSEIFNDMVKSIIFFILTIILYLPLIGIKNLKKGLDIFLKK